ncbi:hypothetical protein ABZ570_15460 [Micromonospora sp. NPDC007271]|uniref:hypothetical protein n=1 Tax=Micromonospora sp. NPDC007271 TaxID=3154587 RepID=UPI0033F3E560
MRCVATFSPFGLIGTFAYLDHLAGDGDPSDRLIAAADVLDAGHLAWRDELALFAQRRKSAKARGLRRVTQAEVEKYATFGWPGSLTGETTGRALDERFLRACGLALWTPEPVNLRRRLRWSERALQPPPRFEGCLPGCMVVVEAVIAALAWAVFTPPRIFWYSFGSIAAVALVVAVIDGFRRAAEQRPRHRSTVELLTRRREALTERLRLAEQQSQEARAERHGNSCPG